MQHIPDCDLLDQFARTGAEEAFGELVRRHIGLVHSVASRHTENPHHAEEIAQAVFIILARKAGTIRRRAVLSGWLYHTARLTAANFRRSEMRRIRREQEAFMQSTPEEPTRESAWAELSPLLDEAMARLGTTDRAAVVLRYFENRTLSEVGAALGVEECTAQKRVSRALEKLRKYFTKRGVVSTSASIAGALTAHSVQAAPAALAKSVTAVGIAKGSIAAASTLTLVKGTLNIMTWIKTKTAMVIASTVLVAGAALWQVEGFHSDVLDQQPAQVKILPSKLTGDSHGWGSNGKMMGTGVSAATLVSAAYDYPTTARTFMATKLPGGHYDYIASLTNGNGEALRREVKRKFGVTARIEMRETSVMLLKVKTPNAPALKPSTSRLEDEYESWGLGHYESKRKLLGHFTCTLEQQADVPVLDRTGFTNSFDIHLDWDQTDLQNHNWSHFNQTLDQLGLELVPSRESIQMLVVEKAR